MTLQLAKQLQQEFGGRVTAKAIRKEVDSFLQGLPGILALGLYILTGCFASVHLRAVLAFWALVRGMR